MTATRITAKRVKAGDVLVKALGYPDSTLAGEVTDARLSPGGGCVLLTFEAGELMLYPTDVVEIAKPSTCGYHGDDTTTGRCETCDSLEVVPRAEWNRLKKHGYASYRLDGHPAVLRLTPAGTALVPVLIGE